MVFQLNKHFGYLINRCSELMRSELESKLSEEGISTTSIEWGILVIVSSNEGLSVGEIAGIAGKDKTTIVRQVDQLEKKHLISKVKDKTDLRVSYVYLSEKGSELVKKILPIAQRLVKDCVSDISKKDYEVTINSLNKILKKLEK